MQPLQYDLGCPAAEDNTFPHAAVAPKSLDAAISIRSADTELQNPITRATKHLKLNQCVVNRNRTTSAKVANSNMQAAIHSIRKCKPIGHQTQRAASFQNHFRAALTMGTTRAPAERQPNPSHKQGSPHRRWEALYEKT